jgi:hypothetical protein
MKHPMSFDMAKISRAFEDVSHALSPGCKLTAADREILRLRLDELRRFHNACLGNSTEIERLLNWVRTPRGTTPHGSRNA